MGPERFVAELSLIETVQRASTQGTSVPQSFIEAEVG